MRRAAVSVFLLLTVTLGGAACGDHEAEPTATTFDFSPDAIVSVDAEGIHCELVSGDDGCTLESGSVVSVENTDSVNHHLIGANAKGGNVFDTGAMQPNDEMTLVLTADGQVTVTDELWADGESPTLEISVTPAPADD